MALPNIFKLEKLKIAAYKDEARLGIADATFELMFNPESYSLAYENIYSKRQGINTSGRTAKYALSKPSEFSLKIIIDGTGVSDFGLAGILGKTKDVHTEVTRFLDLTAYMDGDVHEPKFLVVKWGKLVFSCRLKSANVTYTLFDNGGKPLRAEIDTQFIDDQEVSKRLKKEGKNSPDLTHIRLVKAHDTLPLLCEEIYGSSSYYIKVAQANKLDNFRNLIPGQQLFFPPLEK